jgi:threonyl-tRNA synthetase
MLVVGDKEIEAGTVSVRPRTGKERRGVATADFVAQITEEVAQKRSPETA